MTTYHYGPAHHIVLPTSSERYHSILQYHTDSSVDLLDVPKVSNVPGNKNLISGVILTNYVKVPISMQDEQMLMFYNTIYYTTMNIGPTCV